MRCRSSTVMNRFLIEDLLKTVTAHAHGAQGIIWASQAGVDSIEHGSYIDDAGIAEMKKDGELRRRSRLRLVKYLNNIVEQDHRNVKRLTRPGLGFGSFWTARRTLAGYEAMAMMRKGQVRNINGSDIKAQAAFIAKLFEVAV